MQMNWQQTEYDPDLTIWFWLVTASYLVTINPFYKRYDKLDKYVVVYVEINIDFHVIWEKLNSLFLLALYYGSTYIEFCTKEFFSEFFLQPGQTWSFSRPGLPHWTSDQSSSVIPRKILILLLQTLYVK